MLLVLKWTLIVCNENFKKLFNAYILVKFLFKYITFKNK